MTINELAYGPEHPVTGSSLGNLGRVQQELDELPAARAAFERALAIFGTAYGPDHPSVVRTRAYADTIQ